MQQRDRYDLIFNLSDVIGSSKLNTVASSVYINSWRSEAKGERLLARYPKPFHLCFEHVMHQLELWSLRHADGEAIVPVLAEQEEYNPRCEYIFSAYKTSARHAGLFKPLTFANPVDCLPLQASDMFAWLCRDDWNRYATRGPGYTRELLYRATKQSRYSYSKCFNDEALRLAVDDFNAGRGAFGELAQPC